MLCRLHLLRFEQAWPTTISFVESCTSLSASASRRSLSLRTRPDRQDGTGAKMLSRQHHDLVSPSARTPNRIVCKALLPLPRCDRSCTAFASVLEWRQKRPSDRVPPLGTAQERKESEGKGKGKGPKERQGPREARGIRGMGVGLSCRPHHRLERHAHLRSCTPAVSDISRIDFVGEGKPKWERQRTSAAHTQSLCGAASHISHFPR